ncbi:unnamed protein product [Calicophoron daubneyi]|uniref:FGFR1 oncogene partner (FOP) N-terminal dimerisation domain-containing protein n=1 Tax=Calicophoron daubneyi TaxID=300641 RepID=A0AAV2TN73_CALDB
MSTVEELKRALMENLESKGTIRKLKADLMANIFESLAQEVTRPAQSTETAELSNTKFLIRELIMEYLAFENLQFTESVFRTESGHGDARFSRRLLCQTLRIRPTVNVKSLSLNTKSESNHPPTVDKPVPLLYYIIDWLQRRPLEMNGNALEGGEDDLIPNIPHSSGVVDYDCKNHISPGLPPLSDLQNSSLSPSDDFLSTSDEFLQ